MFRINVLEPTSEGYSVDKFCTADVEPETQAAKVYRRVKGTATIGFFFNIFTFRFTVIRMRFYGVQFRSACYVSGEIRSGGNMSCTP